MRVNERLLNYNKIYCRYTWVSQRNSSSDEYLPMFNMLIKIKINI